MKVCLGGTFEPLHAGHEALLRAAANDADEVFVGITDGKLAHRTARKVSPWQERAAKVEAFLRKDGYKGKVVTRALTEPHGPAVTGDYDAIAASPETVEGALAINALRLQKGKAPLQLIRVPHVLGSDLLPVSATAIAEGRIDARGKRLSAVGIAVGSANPVKVAAIGREVGRILGVAQRQGGSEAKTAVNPAAKSLKSTDKAASAGSLDSAAGAVGAGGLDVRAFAVKSGVPEQPRGAQTLRGARIRARKAREAWPESDYAVGVEAGLVRYPEETMHLEAQACVVIDRNGWETHGWGPGFAYPSWVTERALRGEMVSAVLGPVADDPAIGSTTGAIGYLSEGRLDRTALTQIAVLMAFMPRFRRDLYVGPVPG